MRIDSRGTVCMFTRKSEQKRATKRKRDPLAAGVRKVTGKESRSLNLVDTQSIVMQACGEEDEVSSREKSRERVCVCVSEWQRERELGEGETHTEG